jgi:hypothetical protein
MTGKSESAREEVEKFGGIHRIPKPVEQDLTNRLSSAVFGFYARTWAQRVEVKIKEKRLSATQSEVVTFFERLTDFEDAKKSLQEKRGTKSLVSKVKTTYENLYEAAAALNIKTAVSRNDDL